jgi:cell division protein FtsL
VLRLLHLVVIGCLVAAAVALYQVKYQSTAHVQRIAKLRSEIRTERERISWLRAEWGRLGAPERIQDLAQRHLGMKPVALAQAGEIAALPEKPVLSGDPIGDLIETFDSPFDRSALDALVKGN